MTTYRGPASTETDPQAPGVSALFKALADNPVAITEGASGAPRIQPAAYAQYIDEISHAGTTVDQLDLTYAAKYLRADVYITKGSAGATAPDFRVRASSDGGATWGAYRNLLTVGLSATAYQFTGFLWINVETGAFRLVGISGTGVITRDTNTIAVAAGTNALEFSFTNTNGTPTGSHLFAYMGHAT